VSEKEATRGRGMEGFQGEGNDLCGVGRWEGAVLYEKTLYYIIFRI
jgi:hypothetical protein